MTLNSSGLWPPPTGENTPAVLGASETGGGWVVPGSIEVSHPLPLKQFAFNATIDMVQFKLSSCYLFSICSICSLFSLFELIEWLV